MEMLLIRIVLAVAVTTSLCGIMLGTRALVYAADYVVVMRMGFHRAFGELYHGQRLGEGHISDQAA